MAAGQGIDVGDAVMHFLADTSQLDQAFTQIPAKAKTATDTMTVGFTGFSDVVERTKQGFIGFDNIPDKLEEINPPVEHVKVNLREAQGEAMLLGDAFGIHLPRHVTRFIATIPGVGEALQAAFAATAVLFIIDALIKGIEKLEQWREETHKIALAQDEFQTAVLTSFNSLDEKLLQAGIKLDDLRGNHVDALRKAIELIDKTSLKELEQNFNILAKAADAMFAQLQSHWFELGSGSAGASAALKEFKNQYDLLLAAGQKKEASDLLAGTLKSAKDTLETMLQAKKEAEAVNTMEEQGRGPTEKELQAQKDLITVLQAQVIAEQKINELAKDEEQVKAAQEAKRATEEHQKAMEKLTKAIKDGAAARAAFDKMVEKSEEETSKAIDLRLKLQLKDEDEAAKAELERIHQADQADIARIDGEIERERLATQQKAELYKHQYDVGLISGAKYESELQKLYATEKQNLIRLLNEKEQLVIIEAQVEAAKRGQILTVAQAKELKAYIDLENKKLQITQQADARLAKAEDAYEKKIIKGFHSIGIAIGGYNRQLHLAQQEMDAFGATGTAILDSLSNAVGSAYGKWIAGEESFGAAVKQAVGQVLASWAEQDAVAAIRATALGFYLLATMDYAGAGQAFQSAAIYAAAAAVEGGAAMALGGGASKGASSSKGTSGGGSATSSDSSAAPGAAQQPVQKQNVIHLASGALVTGPTLAMVGDSRAGGSGREAIIPLDDSAALGAIAGAIAQHLSHGGGDTHNWYIEGVISSDNLNKVTRQISRNVSRGRSRLLASNSIRITRRA